MRSEERPPLRSRDYRIVWYGSPVERDKATGRMGRWALVHKDFLESFKARAVNWEVISVSEFRRKNRTYIDAHGGLLPEQGKWTNVKWVEEQIRILMSGC